jgi:hypothetical protein
MLEYRIVYERTLTLPPLTDKVSLQELFEDSKHRTGAGVERQMAMMEGLQRISDTVWEIPVSYKEGMRVPARIYGTEKLIQELDDAVYDQVTNVATLARGNEVRLMYA